MRSRVRALSLRALFSSLVIGTALVAGAGGATAIAQNAPPPGAAPVLAIKSPGYTAGNITITGIAVECRSGAPATRVAIYDGPDENSPYVADVSMDTLQDMGRVCPGRSGPGRIGFTLIYNSRLLNEGPHDFWFSAEYPDGSRASQVVPVYIENHSPYEHDLCFLDPRC